MFSGPRLHCKTHILY